MLRRWFGPHLTHDRLEISKNSSAPQSEGVLKGILNCWQLSRSMYIKRNNVRGTLYALTANGSVPVAMVNNVLPFYPQSCSSCVMTLRPNLCVRRKKTQTKKKQTDKKHCWLNFSQFYCHFIVNIQIIETF